MPASTKGVDLLSLWRCQAPNLVPSMSMEGLSAALIARARTLPSLERLEGLILRAEARDPIAWVLLAEKLPSRLVKLSKAGWAGRIEVRADIEGSCLWVAAALGLPWAYALLTLRVVSLAKDGDGDPEMLSLAAEYARMAGPCSTEPTAAVIDLGIFKEIVAPHAPGSSDQDAQSPGKNEERPSGENEVVRPSIRVLAAVPPSSANREDKALIDRYAELARPVELAGMPDPDLLAAQLLAEFPWMPGIIEAVRSDLMLARRLGCHHFRLSPVLIVGPSGVGKSRFAKHLAALSGVPMGVVMAAGSTDNRALTGTARGWSTTMPCLPLVTMLASSRANPIIIVDGIDDAGGSAMNGAISRTLLGMLDPATARAWPDECLLVPADLSRVSWVLVARRRDRIPADLLSRCRILQVLWPRAADFDVILNGALTDVAGEHGREVRELPELEPQVISAMRRGFASGRLQARQLTMIVRRALAAAAEVDRAMPRH
jgi:ATP-dependent Lon protease